MPCLLMTRWHKQQRHWLCRKKTGPCHPWEMFSTTCTILLLRNDLWLSVWLFIHAGFNSSPPSASYMLQWTGSALVQIMACHLFSIEPFSWSHYLNQCWLIVNWTLRNKLQWNLNRNTKLFTHKNASENDVCEMAAILSRERRVPLWTKVV